MDFARTDAEASEKFEKFKRQDPYPEILPALLNSADIKSYVSATGMIFPFYNDKEKLKTASYEIDLLGKVVYWDEHGEKVVEVISRGKEFKLRKNSIAFVTLEPMFRVPSYIALRFNLKITHVYRGLLLGTGPLIDPGYTNRLSIPLHNLTTNEYVFVGGEALIWMEFTKVSSPPDPLKPNVYGLKRFTDVADFPVRKNQLNDVEDYLRKADPHRPIRSSIPEAIDTKLRGLLTNIGWGAAAIAMITAILGAVYALPSFVSLIHDANTAVTNASDRVNEVARQLEQYKKLETANSERIKVLELKMSGATTKGDATTKNTKLLTDSTAKSETK